MLRPRIPLVSNQQAGFTLLEIIIALTIVVIALIGVYGGLVRNVKTTADVEERLVANWVAANAVAETRIESRDGVLALKNETVEMGGRRWRYEMLQTDAANPNVAKIDVSVYIDGDNSPSTTVTAYLQRVP